MPKVNLGKSTDGHRVMLDVGRLIKTRMLVTSNSGGGKSWLLRLLFEQLGQSTQLIVLDREGEFVSLREKLDVLLVGPLGEIPTDVRSAGLLVRRLMEKQISAVIDMGELPLKQQRQYVKLFLEAMIGLPKTLWHPCIVGLDETHLFCPEKGSGEAESSEAVINLTTLGRKRGFCPIFATQRISKFHKDAAAELNNKFIGRTSLDVDQKRACDELGMGKDGYRVLRELSPPGEEGQFFGYGPALEIAGVFQFQAGQVTTTHPEPGQGRMIEPPKPSRAIAAALAELTDLPQQAEEEAKTMADAKRTIADLKRQLKSATPVVDEKATERAVASALIAERKKWEPLVSAAESTIKKQRGQLDRIAELAAKNGEVVTFERPAKIIDTVVPKISQRQLSPTPARASARAISQDQSVDSREQRIGGGALRMVQVLADRHPAQFTEAQWATMSGLKRTGGTWGTYKSRLVGAGLIEQDRGMWRASETAVDQFGDASRAPQTPDELLADWKSKLGSGSARMLDALWEGPKSKAELAEAVNIEMTGGSFGTYLSRLRSNGLVEQFDGRLQLTEAFS